VGRRWQSGRDRDEAVVEDVLAQCRVLLRLAGNTANHDDALPVVAARRERLGSVFDLTTLVLQLAPERGTPSHTAALLLRGEFRRGFQLRPMRVYVCQCIIHWRQESRTFNGCMPTFPVDDALTCMLPLTAVSVGPSLVPLQGTCCWA
jgi:hypothetical protein